MFMIARFLQMRDNPLSKHYSQAGHDLRMEVEHDEGKQKQSIKESEHYRSHEYFLRLIDEKKDQTMEYKEHIKFLILCMTVYQPVVRTSFYYTAKFISPGPSLYGPAGVIPEA